MHKSKSDITEKLNEIEERKRVIGSRNDRKKNKHSDRFNEIFSFFLRSYRCGVLTFCGVNVEVLFDKSGEDAKNCFKKYENGFLKDELKSKHSNVFRAVVIGKKAWGLYLKEWTDGITDLLFTKREFFEEFEKFEIKIPKSLLVDFENVLDRKFREKYSKDTPQRNLLLTSLKNMLEKKEEKKLWNNWFELNIKKLWMKSQSLLKPLIKGKRNTQK